ncbi:MAG: type II/IV secretion system protein [Patescibacteria group bacterium]
MVLPDSDLKKIISQRGAVDEKNLALVEEFAKATKVPLSVALVEKGILTDEQVGTFMATAYNVPFVSLSKISVSEDVAHIIPDRVARRRRAVVFERSQTEVKIAMSDPSDKALLSSVARKTGLRAMAYYATPKDIDRVLQLYKKVLQKEIDTLLTVTKPGVIDEAPVVKIVDELIYDAYQNGASDIHIEPDLDGGSLIRFRIDGVLQDVSVLPSPLHDRIITRIKVLSNLRTDEHLSAQDGKMRMSLTEEELDIRVSIVPVADGEKSVLRLLSSRSREYTLVDLGMSEADLAKVNLAISKSFGMVLSTGPTGSGKTTTIYAILKILNTREKNITSVEDPVEYRIKGANQIHVNPKTNLTFASGLRSILRQDPNIIFVGEIRDAETAGIAVNAALTGHLVLTTIHTNDAATTIPRLIDMKVEPYLVGSTVNVIIGQRLVRKNCEFCRAEVALDREDLVKNLNEEVVTKYFGKEPKIKVYKGKGCKVCNMKGYSGRIGIFEILLITNEMKKLILEKTDSNVIAKEAIKNGMTTMLDDGLTKVAKGLTTIEEVLRVTKVEEL